MGYKVQFDNGQSVEFDREPTADDIEEAFQATSSRGKGQKSLDDVSGPLGKAADFVGGIGETLTTGILNAAGGVGAAVGGSVRGMLDPNETASSGMERGMQAYGDTVGKVLAPQTKTGQYIEEKIGHAIESFKDYAGDTSKSPLKLIPGVGDTLANSNVGLAAGAVASAMPEASIMMMGGGKKAPKPQKGANVEGAIADLTADKPSSSSADRPTPSNPAVDARNAQYTDRAVMDQLVEADKKASIKDAPEFKALWDKVAADGDVALLEKLKGIDEQINTKQDGAQSVLDRRQAEMEQQVAQRAGLDFNAAERARQEQAPTGYAQDAYMQQERGQLAENRFNEQAGALAPELNALQRQMDETTQGRRAEQGAAQAQEAIQRRQQGIETDVTRQTSLDMNAAERGRQEGAPTGFRDWQGDRAMDSTANALGRDPLGAKLKTAEGPQLPPGEAGLQHQFKSTLADRALSEHPFLRKAEERVLKQEELITKLSEQVNKGKESTMKLAREVKNLENFEAALERTRQNLASEKPISNRGAQGRQRGAINPEVFKEGFEKLKQLADGTWLRAHSDGRVFSIEAIKDSQKQGRVDFIKPRDDMADIKSDWTDVKKDARGKGLATEMYTFASELGNDIKRSSELSEDGRGMWKGFEEKGLAQRGRISSKGPQGRQRGAVQMPFGQRNQGNFLNDQPHLKLPTIVPMKLTAEQVIAEGASMADVKQKGLQKIINYATKGAEYQALKTDNILIKYGYEQIGEADRVSRGMVQEYIHDKLGPASRDLSKREAAEIWVVVSEADRLQRPVDLESLARNGYNEKQLKYVEAHREVMDKAFDMANEARRAAGKEPISRRIAYAAMKATGDYRRLVYKLDEAGEKRVAGIVGADSRWLLDHRMEKLIERGFDNFGEEKYYGGVPRDRGSVQQAMQQTIEILAEKDPRVKEFLDVVDQLNRDEAYSFMNAKKHTMQKKGIFGMEGRKTWETAEANAKEGMQAQLDYAESMFKWGPLSKAVEEISKVSSSDKLNMPVAKRWVEDYVRNALGYNPSELGHLVEMGVAKGIGATGFGYSNVRGGVAVARKITNTMLLALSPRFWTANVVQPMKAMPGMKAYLITKGLDANFDFGTGWSYLAKAGMLEYRARTGKALTAIEADAYSYAKSHHVYGSDLVEHSNRATKDLAYRTDKVGNFMASNIESGTRRMMFFSFVEMLHQNGLSKKNGLFEAAHNLTDMAMNNYSAVERPKMYNSMGPLGDISVNLQSYKHNELSRTALFARQLMLEDKKSARPLVAELATGLAFAGLKGTILFAEVDQIYKEITKLLGEPDSLTLLAIRLSEQAGAAMGNNPKKFEKSDALVSHGVFSLAGIDMSASLGLSDVVPNSVVDAVAPGFSKLGAMAGSAAKAAWYPSEMNAKKMAREWSPRPVATNMELEWFSKGDLGSNVENLKGGVKRNDADKLAKRFGFTGIHESVDKTKKFEVERIKTDYADLRKGPLEAARNEIYTDGKVSNATVQKYIKYDGDVKTLVAEIGRMKKDQNMSAKDAALLQSSMSKSITNLRHAQRLRKAYENE